MEFYQIASITTKPETFIEHGFRVISFGRVKAEIMSILKDRETAIRYHSFNYITDKDEEMQALHEQLEKIVFKESRGNSYKMAIGWENGNSYLRYHSGIIYKWFSFKYDTAWKI